MTTAGPNRSDTGVQGQRSNSTRVFSGARAHAWLLLVAFFVVLNGTGVIYWSADLEVSAGLQLIIRALAIVVFWRLLEAECAPYRIAFPLDMGYFLYATNFLLLPYYFWRTQRWLGLGKLLAVAGIWLGTYSLWEGVAWLVALE